MFGIFKSEKKISVDLYPMAYVFMGRSGSGKGTQVEMVRQEFEKRNIRFLHIETGALLREYAKGPSYIQKIVKNLIEAGDLAPDPIVVGTWINHLASHFNGVEQMLFDGAPRKLIEAVFLDNTMRFLHIEKYKVINIDVSRAECVKRLTARMRGDDTPAGIDHRMDWYETDVIPAMNFFRSSKDCVVWDINGEQTPEAIHEDIMRKINLPQ